MAAPLQIVAGQETKTLYHTGRKEAILGLAIATWGLQAGGQSRGGSESAVELRLQLGFCLGPRPHS